MEKGERARLDAEREELTEKLSQALELPMTVLGFVWLVLVVVELTSGLSPFLGTVNTTIWIVFIAHFALEFAIAPRKLEYLRRNWLTALALALPALRVLRIGRVARALRATRGLRLVRVVSSANRGMRSVGRVMGRRGLGYVLSITLLVNVLGAAGIYAFERGTGAINGFGEAMWWTAMTLTTMGTDYFPLTGEGRMLALLLATYGFAIFGYVTASIASVFVARDAEEEDGELAGGRQVTALRLEIAQLALRVERLAEAVERRGGERDPGRRRTQSRQSLRGVPRGCQ